MKEFHISDVLTITTGRLVSNRHMDGVYDILNYLTGDNLMTHQLPRAMRDVMPSLRAQLPTCLFPENPTIQAWEESLLPENAVFSVEPLRASLGMPEMIPLEPMDGYTPVGIFTDLAEIRGKRHD